MPQDLVDNQLSSHRQELLHRLGRLVTSDGTHSSAIPALHFTRASNVSKPLQSLYEPSLCIIVQGSKVVMLLDSGRGLAVSSVHFELLDAVLRLARLLDHPDDISILSSLIIREILYRLLQDKDGSLLKHFAMIGSPAQRIAQVISYIHRHFAESLLISELAKQANMSASSLHNQFKIVTAMSPLQYQKLIRLQEARRLLLSGSLDAADIGYQVGYESPSQFSREYARLFGLPPISDLKRLKDTLPDTITILR